MGQPMANSFRSSKIASFSRAFPVLLIVAIMFQLLLAKDELNGFASIWDEILKNIHISLAVSLIAAGAFVLFNRNEDEE
ncbi:MAG: hypothetical protein A2079_00565 [Geobacteraceae bacterium GWC2_48_7]|nr:MAG: hypothetical protein A2079_00565 [Geobacteraceae bacterium GWC2_48_7]